MTTPIFPASQPYFLPRPDRLYRQLVFRRRPAALGRELVHDLLAQCGLIPLGRIETANSAGRSDTAIVETSAGRKVLKRYKATIEPAAVVHEHSLLSELERIGFPAPRLTPTLGGETLIRHGGACYAVFEFLEGYFQYHNYVLLPSQARRFIAASGRALGALHDALRDFVPAGRHPNGFKSRGEPRWRDLSWFTAQLDECRRRAPERSGEAAAALRRALADDAGWVERRLSDLDQRLALAAPPRLIVHGDYGPYNLLFRRGAPVVILDFELARLEWRLTDLATALPSFARSRLGFSLRKMRCFVDAYRAVCPIDRAEIELLPDVWQFLSLRRVVVGWSRFAESGSPRWLAEAREKLDLARWVEAERSALSRVLG
jgi:Ser/Thr protein kinase RdoA (MazF antagonist)